MMKGVVQISQKDDDIVWSLLAKEDSQKPLLNGRAYLGIVGVLGEGIVGCLSQGPMGDETEGLLARGSDSPYCATDSWQDAVLFDSLL
eukprot:7982326-Lingulodinium_polyedra.AAC.1